MPSSKQDEVRDYGFADQALALCKRAGLTQRELGTIRLGMEGSSGDGTRERRSHEASGANPGLGPDHA
jgi:hypothetical protein